jgi:hypothetical protein
MSLKRRSYTLSHDEIAGNKHLRVLRDTRELRSVLINEENANMKLIKVTFVVSLLAMLSGCILVPVGPGFYSGSSGYYGSSGSYDERGGHRYR